MADSNQEYPDNVNVITAEDGSTWVEIASVGTEDEANIVKGFLDAEGIRAQVEVVNFSMEPVNFGKMGDIRVYVQSENEQRTQELMRNRDQQFERLDDDDETLVTDDGPASIEESAVVEPMPADSDDGTTRP